MHYVSCIFINFIINGLYAKYLMSPSDAVDWSRPWLLDLKKMTLCDIQTCVIF